MSTRPDASRRRHYRLGNRGRHGPREIGANREIGGRKVGREQESVARKDKLVASPLQALGPFPVYMHRQFLLSGGSTLQGMGVCAKRQLSRSEGTLSLGHQKPDPSRHQKPAKRTLCGLFERHP